MAAESFWTNPGQDPKRAYRFKISITAGAGKTGFGTSQASWYASKADKPKFSVTETAHKYINHTFHYPGRVEWENVTVTLVDPVNPDAAKGVATILKESGYEIPSSTESVTTTINKKSAIKALGQVKIMQLGDTTNDIVETWILQNAWIQQANFSALDYESEDLSTIELVFRYDWAELLPAEGPVIFRKKP